MSDQLQLSEHRPAADERPTSAPSLQHAAAYLRLRTQERKTAEYRERAKYTAERLRYRQYVRDGLPMDVMRRTRGLAIRHLWWIGPLIYTSWRTGWNW